MTVRFRLLPSTIRGRLALTYGLCGTLLILGFGSYLIVTIRGRYESRLENQLLEQAQMTAAVVSPLLTSGSTGADLDRQIDQLGTGIDTELVVLTSDARVVADSKSDPGSKVSEAYRVDTLKAIALSSKGATGSVEAKNRNVMSVAVPVPGAPGAIARASASLDEVDAAVERFQRTVLATALLVIWGTLVVAFYVAGRITEPLEELRRHAVLVAGGQLDTAVTPSDTRELGDLARAFNTMTRRIRVLVAEIEDSRSRLEAIFANLTDGVIVVDEANVVVGMNTAAATMLNTRVVAAVGQPFVIAARDVDLQRLLRTAFDSGEHQGAMIDYARTGRIFDAAAQPIDRGGEQLGIVVIRDVTELRRLETVRREFVANVSHELRTPLASIRSLVETLEAGAIDDPSVAGDFFGRVVSEVDRLTALVDELLDLARIESGRLMLRLERIDSKELVTAGGERLRPQIERAQLRLVIDVEPGLPPVMADRTRVEQVLVNLVHNAIKFTRPGGTIAVRARPEGDRLAISVADTGVGIAPLELTRVFERFFKSDRARRSDGTGLGLAIAKHIVQTHGGSIWATSEPGIGSTFTFTLPFSISPEQVPAADRPAALRA
jgi:two-component system phosphate regulon sensor histidine kinase PhoR